MDDTLNHEYAIDIETIPNPDMINLLPEPEVKTGNTKDPAKIQAKVDEAKQKQIDSMALNPLYGKICCICAYSPNDQRVYCDLDEKKIITAVMEDIFNSKRASSMRIITWNGMNFDAPFIFKRALLLGLSAKSNTKLPMWAKRYSNYPHTDLMQLWSNWSFQGFTKLDDMGNVLLGEKKIDLDYRLFSGLMETETGRNTITEYCMQDCKLTWDINEKYKDILY